jgi:hypothetical protein
VPIPYPDPTKIPPVVSARLVRARPGWHACAAEDIISNLGGWLAQFEPRQCLQRAHQSRVVAGPAAVGGADVEQLLTTGRVGQADAIAVAADECDVMELMSTTILPDVRPAATPSAPNSTRSTSGVSGTMRIMISAAVATA